jgi:FAD synthase
MGITSGPTLGKYASLHRGHHTLIETPLSEMDNVIGVIYDCHKTIDIPLNLALSTGLPTRAVFNKRCVIRSG